MQANAIVQATAAQKTESPSPRLALPNQVILSCECAVEEMACQ